MINNLEQIKEIAEPIFRKKGVEFAGIFGSYARGEADRKSDVDILIRFKTPKSLLDIIGLELELSDSLNRKVDLVTEAGLCPHIQKNVLKDLQFIYGR